MMARQGRAGCLRLAYVGALEKINLKIETLLI